MPLSQLLGASWKELEPDLQLILNAVVEGLCGLNESGRVTFCNQSLLRMTGYEACELIGKPLDEVLCRVPDGGSISEHSCRIVQAVRAKQRDHVVGEELCRKDGTKILTETWAYPLPRSAGASVLVIAIQDITEREKTIAALRVSEGCLRQLGNNLNHVLYLMNVAALRFEYVSPAYETITGRKIEELQNQSSLWLDHIVPGHRQRFEADRARLLAGEKITGEYPIEHRDGRIRWVRDHAIAVRNDTGFVCMLAGVAEDVTEAREASDRLQERERKFQRILTSVPDIAWTADAPREICIYRIEGGRAGRLRARSDSRAWLLAIEDSPR